MEGSVPIMRALLERRAAAVQRVRDFFGVRGVLEVDPPLLQGGANLDHGIMPFRVETAQGPRFLPSSPEHPLKRMIVAGAGAIWTLSPVFRADERGQRHAPEFRMLEWYRPGWNDRQLYAEVIDLCVALTELPGAIECLSWRDAFRQHAGIDPVTADETTIAECLGDAASAVRGDRAAALDLLLTQSVEPHLGRGCWTVLTDYPAAGAAQARLRPGEDGTLVAARFEIYRDGIELANGYWEATDANELGARFDVELRLRNDPALVRDERFLQALAGGFPDCAGVAVGFDRLLMLAWGARALSDVQALPYDQA